MKPVLPPAAKMSEVDVTLPPKAAPVEMGPMIIPMPGGMAVHHKGKIYEIQHPPKDDPDTA